MKKTLKGTIFTKCELPNEVFNANRLIKTKIKQSLARVGYLMLRDGTLEVKGENKPDLAVPEIANVLQELESEFNMKKFDKPDYFANFNFVEGLVSSEEFRKKGLMVHCLNSRMIYPLYGVYMPTSQEYLNLFSNYVSQIKQN